MVSDPLLERAQALWAMLAGAPVSFTPGDRNVVAAPESQLCPPLWMGCVALGGSAIVTVPSAEIVQPVADAIAPLPVDSLTDPEALKAALPVKEVLGPATLAYVSPESFVPVPSDIAFERLDPGHPDLQALMASVSAEDADEGGIGEITAPAVVVREHGNVVAAAGYQLWPNATAHLCLLTATSARGRGLAKQVASAAVARALSDGLLPQWRARPAASQRVAQALGFRQFGAQLSVRLEPIG